MGDFDLTMTIGRSRIAPDESEGERVPSDLSFTTTWQGGPKQLDCSLLRSMSSDGPERPFDKVRLIGPEKQSAWEGRLQRLPRSIDHRTQRQSPQALGGAAAFEDDQAARALFIDRDLGRHSSPSSGRQTQWINAEYRPTAASVEQGGLKFVGTGSWATNKGRPAVVSRYDASPLRVGRIAWSSGEAKGIGSEWGGAVERLNADGSYAGTALADWVTTPASGSPATATEPAQNVAVDAPGVEVNLYYPTAPVTDGDSTREVTLRDLLVVGDHGLPLVGTSAANWGIKASDAWAWIVENLVTGLGVGDIVDSKIGIQHLALVDPQSPGQMWAAINAYHAWAWGVWEDDLVDAHPYGAGRSKTWFVRAGDEGFALQQDGDDAAALWTDIVVSFQLPDGRQSSVGDPGAIAHTTSSALRISDPTHPAIAAGIRRRYHFALDVPAIRETAIAVGQTMLAQLNAARRAGSATIKGYVRDASGRPVPAWRVRGGDQLVVTNIGDSTPRRIVETSYTHGNRTVQCTLDNTLQTVEAIVAHLGARSSGRL